jgi:hypothetical protein
VYVYEKIKNFSLVYNTKEESIEKAQEIEKARYNVNMISK